MESVYSLENVTKEFEISSGVIRSRKSKIVAVDDVSFQIRPGETFGVIGETGSGKTTIAKIMLLVYRPDSGRVLFEGKDISEFDDQQVRDYRRKVQTVFQDPTSSLNPRQNVKSIIEAPLAIYHQKSRDKVHNLLKLVNLDDDYLYRYPHTLSGGEKQRVAIARALALDPEVLLLDEPTSALDVSVQAKIISLLKQLKGRLKITYVFISHDLSLVANFCDRTLVIYKGKMCEMGETGEIFRNPLHPYTRLLLSSVPVVSDSEESAKPRNVPRELKEVKLEGRVGCVFRDRCWLQQKICETTPEFIDKGKDHWVACHFA
ncbi:MAG: ATP-binding cassette domain-containing protein [Thaumarchaeota archaeon]|nr:ATP-binding cassette domain-containing protein [Nitrososphaerota archaeon]